MVSTVRLSKNAGLLSVSKDGDLPLKIAVESSGTGVACAWEIAAFSTCGCTLDLACGAFALSATSLALATNYWRSNKENRDRIVEEGFEQEDIIRALQRVGLLGPLEYAKRYGSIVRCLENSAV